VGIFGNAFATPDASSVDEATLAREDTLFRRLADEVVARGLTTPALLFLEMHRPLSFVAGQMLHSLGPFAGLIVSREEVECLAHAISRRDGMGRLIACIEGKENERHEPAPKPETITDPEREE